MNSLDDVEKLKQKVRNASMFILKDVQKLLQFSKEMNSEKVLSTSTSIAANASDLIESVKLYVSYATPNGKMVHDTMELTKKSIVATMKLCETVCEQQEFQATIKDECKTVAGNIKLINQHISLLKMDDFNRDDDDSSSEASKSRGWVDRMVEITKWATTSLKSLQTAAIEKEKQALITNAKSLSNHCGELLQFARRHKLDDQGENVKKYVLEVISLSKLVYNASNEEDRAKEMENLTLRVQSTETALTSLLSSFENKDDKSPKTENEDIESDLAISNSLKSSDSEATLKKKKKKKSKNDDSKEDALDSKDASSNEPKFTDTDLKPPSTDVMSPKDASKQLQREFSSRDPEKVFKVQDQLGEGASGAVFRAIHRETKKVVAIKKMQVGVNNITSTVKEIKIMKDLKSPYTLKYYGCYNKDDCIWIIMEYCDGGSLQDIIDARENEDVCLTEDQIAQILVQVLKALEYLHSMKKIHRDIKAGNILLNSQGMAKLADFGISAQQIGDEKRTTTIGSSYWMAPETLMGGGYDSKADIWSLGITVLEMAEGIPPLIEEQPHKAAFRIVNDPPPKLSEPSLWSKAFVDFIARCLTKNPDLRPPADVLLTHPFLQNAVGNHDAIIELINWSQKDKKKKAKKSINVEEEMNLRVFFENTGQSQTLLVPGHATAEDVCRQSSELFTLAKDAKSYHLYVVIEDGGKVKEKRLGPYDLPSKLLTALKKKYKKKKQKSEPYKFIYK